VNTPADKVDFTGVRWGSVEWTLLVTLYLRACESRLERPILGDTAAAEAVEKIDYNWSRMRLGAGPWANQFLVALRAKQLDVWTADFLERNPDSVVLHLGCGMDTRAFRLERPATVQWFDVDQPHVVELRRELYTDGPGYRMIGSSVTDPRWLDSIPVDRPVAVVAEGLLPYLTPADVDDLLRRITDRFPGGEVSADVISKWGPRASKLFEWGGDGRRLADGNPRLTCFQEISALAGFDRIPLTPQRIMFRLLHAIPAVRDYDRLYRFGF
jgi:O-methyltransferase involved in polyketide biosynthesis